MSAMMPYGKIGGYSYVVTCNGPPPGFSPTTFLNITPASNEARRFADELNQTTAVLTYLNGRLQSRMEFAPTPRMVAIATVGPDVGSW